MSGNPRSQLRIGIEKVTGEPDAAPPLRHYPVARIGVRAPNVSATASQTGIDVVWLPVVLGHLRRPFDGLSPAVVPLGYPFARRYVVPPVTATAHNADSTLQVQVTIRRQYLQRGHLHRCILAQRHRGRGGEHLHLRRDR